MGQKIKAAYRLKVERSKVLGRGLFCYGLITDAILIYRKLQYENAKHEFQICDTERYYQAMILIWIQRNGERSQIARADERRLR